MSNTSISNTRRQQWLGWALGIIVAGWAVTIFMLLVASLPFSPLSVSRQMTDNIVLFMPEGWGFFTRNPREESTLLYEQSGKGWVLRTLPNAAVAGGASRSMRCQSGELANLLKAVSPTAWRKRQGNMANWKADSLRTVFNVYEGASLCGTYAVVVQKPVPWAWSTFQTRESAEYKYVLIKSICKQ